MDKKREFDVCLELLQQVVAARGKDPAAVAQEYVWPAGNVSEDSAAAVSLAPLLTGGEQPPAPGAPASGVVPMPPGLAPPKS